MEIDRIYSGNGVTIMSQYKEGYGVGVYWGPTIRECYAIMIEIDGKLQPYKLYRNLSTKTLKRARQHLRYYRTHYTNTFKLDAIWESVPLEEMNFTWYENTEKVIEEIEARMGRARGGVFVGLGRDNRESVVAGIGRDEKIIGIRHLSKEAFEQILSSDIEKEVPIRLDTEPAEFGGPPVREEGSSRRTDIDPNTGSRCEEPESERHDSGSDRLQEHHR